MAKALIKTVPLWELAACIICRDREKEEYVDGKQIPCTKISIGHMYAHGVNCEDARARAERVIREVYDEDFLRIDFTNTHLAEGEEISMANKGFSGLELRTD